MPYDLYGQYYASARDAENAEMAQCAAIDANLAYREMDKMRQQMQQPSNEIAEIWLYINQLEERIKFLESKNNIEP